MAEGQRRRKIMRTAKNIVVLTSGQGQPAPGIATGKIHYRIRDRKRSGEFLDVLILDNFSPHTVRAWYAANRVELLFRPTCSSWLNWIDAEFAALRYVALNGTDHRTHIEQDAAIGGHIQRARPDTRSRPHDRALERFRRLPNGTDLPRRPRNFLIDTA